MDEFQKITEKMHQIYLKKNKDYGSSFDRQYDKYGMTSVLIRLSDKLNRLEQITRAGTIEVKDESVDDTLLDLANYAILALIKRQKGKADSGDAAFVDVPEPHKEKKVVAEGKIGDPVDTWKTLVLNGEVPGVLKVPEASLTVCCDGNVVKGIPTIKEEKKNLVEESVIVNPVAMEDSDERSSLTAKLLTNKIKKDLNEAVNKFKESETKEPKVNDEKNTKKGDENPKWKDNNGCKTSVSMWVDEGDGLKEVDPERYPITSFLEDIIDKVFATPSWTNRIYS